MENTCMLILGCSIHILSLNKITQCGLLDKYKHQAIDMFSKECSIEQVVSMGSN